MNAGTVYALVIVFFLNSCVCVSFMRCSHQENKWLVRQFMHKRGYFIRGYFMEHPQFKWNGT